MRVVLQRVVRKGLVAQALYCKGVGQAVSAGGPAEGVVPAKPIEFMEEQGAEWPRWTLEGGGVRMSAVGRGKD